MDRQPPVTARSVSVFSAAFPVVFSAILLALVLATSAAAGAACRQALTLGLDVSGSVDDAEYRLQRDGLAAALAHPDVRAALLAMPSAPVRLQIFEWSSRNFQRILLPWAEITGPEALDSAITRLRGSRRVAAPSTTALGTAMRFGLDQLARHSACWERTLDLSGDGQSNEGPRPRSVQAAASPGTGATINALVVGTDTAQAEISRPAGIAELSAYFRAEVIRGPGAFVETAIGFDDYERAMVRKLLRELRALALSRLLVGGSGSRSSGGGAAGIVAGDEAMAEPSDRRLRQ
ncbi:DUF1194 domain-containing protein [Brevirhabdus sp.]|uniref:DUF1194 domain-containing protein n=1 Tax=Brevirhabdus sp. TaxID=2004514 RepID=UPI004058F951